MKIIIITVASMLLTACTYYQPVPAPAVYTTVNKTSKFDQSWSAAVGALADQGVRINVQDRGAGVIQGTREGIEVTGNIRTQADGRVRVEFNTSGATKSDPTLIERITRSYSGRMGR
ncbi:MAG: hypothetical protein methR_P2028 [Methyloprofundus sp.]|nr:MAG: hypothetical protein methR_P2028 [Methyloprofundus sp.]